MKNIFSRSSRRNDVPPLDTGVLNNGAAYEIRQLDLGHLDVIYKFHLEIHNTLKEEEKTFISRKSRADFEAYLKGKGFIVGTFSKGKLIGMGSLLLPSATCPNTGTADMKITVSPEKVAVCQSDSVLPAYRGNGLQQKMIQARITVARSHGREHMLALADTKNMATIKSLLKCGLAITGTGVDPDDGGAIYHLQGPIPKDKLAPAAKINGPK